jgi:FMN phosphatase YigB (HAD superfamily)
VCLGKDIEALVPMLKNNFHVSLPMDYSLLQDFINRFERNKSIWSVIEYAKKKYKIGLLTNMYYGMLKSIYDKGLMPDVNWDVIIDSSVEKVVKPQKEIFELSQERATTSANEILFVENSKKHVEAARNMNWDTFLYDSSNVVKASQDLLEKIKHLT